jgi:hypothetical protein
MDTGVIHHRGQIITASSLELFVGGWLIISPFVLHFQQVRNATAIDGFFGILICVLAGCRIMGAYIFPGISWTNAIFGFWILVSPFCVGFYHFHTALINNLISGAALILFATWSATVTIRRSHELRRLGAA